MTKCTPDLHNSARLYSLSTYLWGATKDEKYRTAAIQSARWMESLNINANNIVLDTVHANDCSRSPANWIFTYNSGKYVEGLSVLTDITGDTHWRNLMVKIIAAAVKSAPWQAIFIRGLAEVYTRSSSTGNLRPLLRSYIDVQFNALLDLAANGSTYSSTWRGPPQAFTTWGQLAALDVFASAIVAN
ncbi:hypothetical protein NLJ89_g8119 [Agrocybe chaxingu]|uniref:Uncharacterized protein n=1 Tax=Agrocybe chaxingu TaxID=84603 RepID=A0A9W8JW00_9AGAR|nr:hypothetical protein NLJ89_g8119 [Agrocybe chaxingu]